jgi:hypothetical protein
MKLDIIGDVHGQYDKLVAGKIADISGHQGQVCL